MSEPITSVRRLAAVEKQLKALELRKGGTSFLQIASELGYASKSGAYKAVITALRKTLQEPADELRVLEVERIDVALKAIWPFVLTGTPIYIDRFIRLSERRARLLGLDAPEKREIGITGVKGYVNVSPDDWDKPKDGAG